MKSRRADTETGRRGEIGSPLRVPKSPSRRVPLITLLTDFGTSDYFVSAVKGVILSSNPQVRIVDISHDIPPQDIEAGAFVLFAASSSFPPESIHVAVVDPGVGSSRRAILIQTREHYFVGPDNGIFSYICEREENGDAKPQFFHLTKTEYFRQPVSPTFHGRDVFAPVAAALSLGASPGDMGTRIKEIVRLSPLKPERSGDGGIEARIIHVDRFGNCVTNLTQRELTPEMISGGTKLEIKKKWVTSFRHYFTEETVKGEEVFGVWGSAGFLEIAASNASAAKLLKAKRGDPVVVTKPKS